MVIITLLLILRTVVEETSSVPTTNVNPERDFAMLDRLMSEKPNALESLILFSHNQTSKWLCSALFGNLRNFETALRKLAVANLPGQFRNCASLAQF